MNKSTINEMDDAINKVTIWSMNRGLCFASPQAQFLKVAEEVGELAQGIAKDKPDQIVDSFGDVLVTLIVLNQQLRMQRVIDKGIGDCLQIAYQEIKDRKGKMVNGVFVKEEDLNDE
ncbi:MazG-like family protein [Aerococcus mictus]